MQTELGAGWSQPSPVQYSVGSVSRCHCVTLTRKIVHLLAIIETDSELYLQEPCESRPCVNIALRYQPTPTFIPGSRLHTKQTRAKVKLIGKYYLSLSLSLCPRLSIQSILRRLILTDRECEVVVEDPGVLVDVLVVDILTLVHLMVVVWLLYLWYEVI